jgi:hypothetical protein
MVRRFQPVRESQYRNVWLEYQPTAGTIHESFTWSKIGKSRKNQGLTVQTSAPRPLQPYYFGTTSSFFTEKTFGTPLARMPARFLSASVSTTPTNVTFPFLTMT